MNGHSRWVCKPVVLREIQAKNIKLKSTHPQCESNETNKKLSNTCIHKDSITYLYLTIYLSYQCSVWQSQLVQIFRILSTNSQQVSMSDSSLSTPREASCHSIQLPREQERFLRGECCKKDEAVTLYSRFWMRFDPPKARVWFLSPMTLCFSVSVSVC